MNTLKNLKQELDTLVKENSKRQGEIEDKIKVIHFAQFQNWTDLQDAIKRLESYEKVDYSFTEFGDLCSYVRFDVPEIDALELEHLEEYLSGMGFYLNTKYGTIENNQGDYIAIQDDTLSDNGVWEGHRLIIDESEYLDDWGDVNVEKRNALIEAYMEKTGYFPGVFRVTRNGDIYPSKRNLP